LETPGTNPAAGAIGTAKKLIWQLLQHKKDGAFIIDCPAEVVDIFALACRELQSEFDSRGITPVFRASVVAERFSSDSNTLIHTTFALAEASEELASMTPLPALKWRKRLLSHAASKAEAMTSEQQIEYLRHNFPDTTLR
jgi:hypothetical protein